MCFRVQLHAILLRLQGIRYNCFIKYLPWNIFESK